MDELENDEGRPFTEDERKALRKMLESEERNRFLWSTLRIWIGWMGASVAALWAIKDYLVAAIRGAMGVNQ